MRNILFVMGVPMVLFASGDPIIVFALLGGFVVTTVVFFWSIYKAIKTQDKKYAWGMLPFFLFMFVIFL